MPFLSWVRALNMQFSSAMKLTCLAWAAVVQIEMEIFGSIAWQTIEYKIALSRQSLCLSYFMICCNAQELGIWNTWWVCCYFRSLIASILSSLTSEDTHTLLVWWLPTWLWEEVVKRSFITAHKAKYVCLGVCRLSVLLAISCLFDCLSYFWVGPWRTSVREA